MNSNIKGINFSNSKKISKYVKLLFKLKRNLFFKRASCSDEKVPLISPQLIFLLIFACSIHHIKYSTLAFCCQTPFLKKFFLVKKWMILNPKKTFYNTSLFLLLFKSTDCWYLNTNNNLHFFCFPFINLTAWFLSLKKNKTKENHN